MDVNTVMQWVMRFSRGGNDVHNNRHSGGPYTVSSSLLAKMVVITEQIAFWSRKIAL